MKFKKIYPNDFVLYNNYTVTVTEMGNTVTIQFLSSKPTAPPTKKISATEYVDTRTGEILEYSKRSETLNSRIANQKSLLRTMKNIRELIATNITNPLKVRWITLTYKENVKDPKQLYEDYRKFNQRFRYYCQKYDLGSFEYICVAEPQKRGAWHLHSFYIWERNAPFIERDILSRIWSHGFVVIKAIYQNDNLSAYFQAYLTDLEIPDENKDFYHPDDLKSIEVDGQKKSVIKGGRLNLYPENFNILRCSRNIKRPVKRQMLYEEALKLVQGKQLRYKALYRLEDEASDFRTYVYKEEFR